MGFIELLLIICAIVLIAAVAIFAAKTLSPEPIPTYVINLIWGVAIILILLVVLTAFGVVGRDISIPRLR